MMAFLAVIPTRAFVSLNEQFGRLAGFLADMTGALYVPNEVLTRGSMRRVWRMTLCIRVHAAVVQYNTFGTLHQCKSASST